MIACLTALQSLGQIQSSIDRKQFHILWYFGNLSAGQYIHPATARLATLYEKTVNRTLFYNIAQTICSLAGFKRPHLDSV